MRKLLAVANPGQSQRKGQQPSAKSTDAKSGDRQPTHPQAHLAAEHAELSRWFGGSYLQGELLEGETYQGDALDEIPTFCFHALDGPVQVWQHALDLRSHLQDFLVLYHYSNELCFRNVGDMEQAASELFARESMPCSTSLRYGDPGRKCCYNYSNGNPLRADLDDDESQREQPGQVVDAGQRGSRRVAQGGAAPLQAFAVKLFCLLQLTHVAEQGGQVVHAAQYSCVLLAQLGTA